MKLHTASDPLVQLVIVGIISAIMYLISFKYFNDFGISCMFMNVLLTTMLLFKSLPLRKGVASNLYAFYIPLTIGMCYSLIMIDISIMPRLAVVIIAITIIVQLFFTYVFINDIVRTYILNTEQEKT